MTASEIQDTVQCEMSRITEGVLLDLDAAGHELKRMMSQCLKERLQVLTVSIEFQIAERSIKRSFGSIKALGG
jgi:5S rRNA maturation endonuclease (ribonuclease M5)